MRLHFVVEMGEVSHSGFHFCNQVEGFLNGEVGEVVAVAQRVYDKHIEAFQFLLLYFAYVLAIGHVCEVADTVSENRLAAVQHFDGRDLESVDMERVVVNDAHIEFGHAG